MFVSFLEDFIIVLFWALQLVLVLIQYILTYFVLNDEGNQVYMTLVHKYRFYLQHTILWIWCKNVNKIPCEALFCWLRFNDIDVSTTTILFKYRLNKTTCTSHWEHRQNTIFQALTKIMIFLNVALIVSRRTCPEVSINYLPCHVWFIQTK